MTISDRIFSFMIYDFPCAKMTVIREGNHYERSHDFHSNKTISRLSYARIGFLHELFKVTYIDV